VKGHGHYSLIQYSPDLGRAERANIGVLLWTEAGGLHSATSPNVPRVVRFFGRSHVSRAKQVLGGLLDRLAGQKSWTLDSLRAFATTRANALQLTPFRPMRAATPEVDVQRLYDDLVACEAVAETPSTPR